jgi:hypothetical protein
MPLMRMRCCRCRRRRRGDMFVPKSLFALLAVPNDSRSFFLEMVDPRWLMWAARASTAGTNSKKLQAAHSTQRSRSFPPPLTPHPPRPLSLCRCTSKDFQLAREQLKKFSEGQRDGISDAQLWRAHTMLAGARAKRRHASCLAVTQPAAPQQRTTLRRERS